MSTDLFPDLPPSPSPRLAWLDRYGLTLRRLDGGRYECALDDENYGRGDDEDEAVVAFCVKTKLPHYSQ